MSYNPLSPYASQKVQGEYYGKLFHKLYGLETIGLRYFNIFGPRQDPDSEYSAVIPKFIKAILNNRQPTIYGDGETSRDFTYIQNVVEANLNACQAQGAGGKAFNVACGSRYSLKQLVQQINQIIGKDSNGKVEGYYTTCGEMPTFLEQLQIEGFHQIMS